MRITAEQRQHTEQRIRAAMDRLLRGDLPTNGGCDIKTLATEAAITRNGLYTTYRHLKEEFEQRRQRLDDTGTDRRHAQVTRLKTQVEALRERVAQRDTTLDEMTTFRTHAISRLAAQHEEILRLRTQIASQGNVRALRPAAPNHANRSD